MNKITTYVIIGILLVMIGYLLGIRHRKPSEPIVQRDTVVLFDTVKFVEPAEDKKETLKDTIPVEVKDTMWLHDTCYIALPLEKRTYKREDFYAEVTGYDPRLTYIEVYPKTVVVSKTEIPTEKKNYLAIGVEAGWCIKPYTPIYLEYSRMLHKNIVFNAGVFRDLVRQENGMKVGIKAQIGW